MTPQVLALRLQYGLPNGSRQTRQWVGWLRSPIILLLYSYSIEVGGMLQMCWADRTTHCNALRLSAEQFQYHTVKLPFQMLPVVPLQKANRILGSMQNFFRLRKKRRVWDFFTTSWTFQVRYLVMCTLRNLNALTSTTQSGHMVVTTNSQSMRLPHTHTPHLIHYLQNPSHDCLET